MDLNFEQKYLKYKSKYLQTKQFGGLGGHLQVYFLTNEQYDELKKKDTHNFKKPGLKISEKNDSGLKEKYIHAIQHDPMLNIPAADGKKVNKVAIGTDVKFDYTNPDHISKVISKITTGNPPNKIMLIRDYSLLHDVFVGAFNIGADNKLTPDNTLY